MRTRYGQHGFTLMEVLVALATVLVLIAALMGIGSYVRTRANIDLTKSMLTVLGTALEQYYDDTGGFPFDTDTNNDNVLDASDAYTFMVLESDLGGTVSGGILPLHPSASTGPASVSSASSVSLFYFLDQYPSSRAIAESIANTLITNKDDGGIGIRLTITATGNTIDLPRYVDAWGTSIRYVYLPGTAFPVLTSAGPDEIFDTPDDITSQ